MSDLDLAAIKARCAAATPGPWTPKTGKVWHVEIFEHPTKGGLVATITTDCGRSTVGRMNANAEFIAHARTDVPALVAEVERLRARELQPGTFVRCRCGSAFPPKKQTGMCVEEHTCPGCRRAEAAEDQASRLRSDLAECYRITGADPDGDDDAMLARKAVAAVKRLREESDTGAETADKRIAELEDVLEDVRDNYDCDEGAHKYRTPCRACEAKRVLLAKGGAA